MLEHPLTPPTIATARATISSPLRRLRRGTANRSREAMVTPEPAYQGMRLGVCSASIVPEPTRPESPGDRSSAVMPDIVTIVVAEAVDVRFTDAVERAMVGVMPVEVATVAVKFTVPVKPLAGAAVMVTAGILPPAATTTLKLPPLAVAPVALGVRLKSGHVVEVTVTISGEVAKDPLDVCVPNPEVSAGPFEPANVASPE